MPKRKQRWLLAGCGAVILLTGYLIINSNKPQLSTIDLSLSPAPEIKEAFTRMYVLQDTVACVPGTGIDTLTAVLIDTGDYQPSLKEWQWIIQVFGLDGLSHAGLLTAKQAYYQLWLIPSQVAPPAGVNPTPPPVVYCPGPPFQIKLSFKSIALETSDKAIAKYYYVNGDYEAVLINIGGKWLVSGVKLIHWYGNG